MIIREDFMHWLWQHKKMNWQSMQTVDGLPVVLKRAGRHNTLAGPDFFNARLEIDGQQWAGNVELHIRSSDWYAHGHEQDAAYQNVVLHVVWEDDVAVYNLNNQQIPTVVLRDFIAKELIDGYHRLFVNQQKKFILCESDFAQVPDIVLHPWLDRMFLERLEQKVDRIDQLLKLTENDWEAVLFIMLARNFGTKVNAAAFETMAKTLPFRLIRRLANEEGMLEALFYGHGNLLPKHTTESQVLRWQRDYKYLRKKFDLPEALQEPIQFFKLRPPNFPTVRLSQLAAVYEHCPNLFSEVISRSAKKEYYEIFGQQASSYWDTHYNFGKHHRAKSKKVTASFVYLLIINTVVPIKFAFAKINGQPVEDVVFDLMQSLFAEKNSIAKGFFEIRDLPENALSSQAVLQLKANYCDAHRCLHCAAGNFLISNFGGT
ncbi:MAG: DUF2851 family protein [Leeuwenhoekiella sp.]